ncbi:hypothetical protein MKX01_019891 [Papaver californicum]|nr:hypothetical protein MKX01_019891 [Papaver californicum]
MDSQYSKLFEKCTESYNLILVLFCLILVTVWWYFIRYKKQVIVQWPIVGLLPSIICNAHRIHDWTVDISKIFGATIIERGPFFGRLEIVYTCDPRNAKQDYRDAFDTLGDGLLTATSNFRTAQRRVAHMTVTSKIVRHIIAHKGTKMAQHALLPLLSHLSKESSIVDLQDVLMRYMFDTSVDIIFGKKSNYVSPSFPQNEFAKAMDDASEAILYRHVMPISWWKLSRRLKIGSNEKKLEAAGKVIDRDIAEYIKVKREEMVPQGTKLDEYEENDLLEVYMGIKDGEKDELIHLITFLITAHDTTASTLSWFFWLILIKPILEKHPVIFDADDQTGMVYLHAALCESLRLYHAVPLLRKTSTSDDVLPDGTVIWPGMTATISCYAMGRMEWVWGKDCLEFKPERWISEDGKLNPEALSKLVSFSLGPRNCIGKGMAFVLMKLVASAVI